MFNTRLTGLIILLIAVLYTYPAKADHSTGGELIYEWVSDSTYKFTFKFYRDCKGIGADGTEEFIKKEISY